MENVSDKKGLLTEMRAHQEGVNAAWAGLPRSACMYSLLTLRKAWLTGYRLSVGVLQRTKSKPYEDR